MIKRAILLARFGISQTTWSEFIEKFDESRVIRKGRVIEFKGTVEDFDKLHDKLIANESNSKIIGIYPG